MCLSVITCSINGLLNKKQLALSMPVEDVHVWQVRLADTVMLTEELWWILSATEKEKTLRLRSEMDQARAILSRGILRTLLGWYLKMEPAVIEFSYGPMGKPFLVTGHGLEFNVTHSDDLILYTFTLRRRVGVDVEHVSDLPELNDVAHSFFSPREQDLLTSLPVSDQRKAFFRLWTLREAYAKIQGNGLTDEMKNMDILSVLKEQGSWVFETFSPLPDYLATVVVEGNVRRLVRFDDFPGIAG